MWCFYADSAGYLQYSAECVDFMQIPLDIVFMSKSIFARKSEIELFKTIETSRKSEFFAVYGRRRIGKTYLIREYFKESEFYFEFTGVKNTTKKMQIKNFQRELNKKFKLTQNDGSDVTDWIEALSLLADIIEGSGSKNKKVIFFDELPWLASKKSDFMTALDYFWNTFASKRKDIILVVCGSAASWMITQLVNNKGGLHNRLTSPALLMKPFSLSQTKDYLKFRNIDLELEQIIELYMATGGVAYYLDQYKKGQSAAQFINESFFNEGAGLYDEFDRLFESLFDNYQDHVDIIEQLSKHPEGLTQIELTKNLKIKSGGSFTKLLTELEKSHFIQFMPQIESKKKDGVYRLVDEYVLFYKTWIKPLGKTIKDKNYWQKQVGKPKYNSWLGTAFENICFKHSDDIKKSLGISGLTTSEFTYRSKHAQIDLIIDRSDKTLNLFEMKYSIKPYEMTDLECKKIKNRKEELKSALKRKRQVFTTLVTPFPAQRNKHYLAVIDNELNLADLF